MFGSIADEITITGDSPTDISITDADSASSILQSPESLQFLQLITKFKEIQYWTNWYVHSGSGYKEYRGIYREEAREIQPLCFCFILSCETK